MADPKWFVNDVEIDYYDIYDKIATIDTLKLEIGNNTIIVNCTDGSISINGEVEENTSLTDTFEPLCLRRTRGERYDKTLGKIIPAFAGWLIGYEATRVDEAKYIKAIWVNPNGTYEWRDHK